MPIGQQDKGAEGAAKGVTSTLGNAAGGVSKTLGGVLGAAGRGVGDTVDSTTGTKQGGDALRGVTGGLEDGANSVGKGAEDAGKLKK
ncbi:hypothetical protein LTR53_012393 [Teratosphaeriaceae sp. CCFEE 6253]|nr:hypothetical protein LTR53_012720 [Teratosphaeriaceae sp. CCFEE 6253]KAK3111899.1 hypothetical protein LTR53_012393 [Teratosphaeriaceae sp. CCFEE 6253]